MKMEPIPLIPKEYLYARRLDDSILPLSKYKESMSAFDGKARRVLDVFSKGNGDEWTGGNTFSRIHLEVLLPNGMRSATRADIELALAREPGCLQDTYFDVGVALHSAKGPNAPRAVQLAKQLRQQGISLDKGKLIPFGALKLTPDAKAEYGLALDLKLNATGITNLDAYNWSYAGSQGLARAYLLRNSNWDSDYGNLANSYGDGRVVVVGAGGAAQNIEALLAKRVAELEAERNKQIAAINKRAEKAMATLRHE